MKIKQYLYKHGVKLAVIVLVAALIVLIGSVTRSGRAGLAHNAQGSLAAPARTAASAVVDWSGGEKGKPVSNELDVMCTRGIMPVFISCKTCAIKTEALNELAILRDRFGGQMARAAIVTAEPAVIAARNRAAELNIRVIDLNDLKNGSHIEMIRRMIKRVGPDAEQH